MPRLIDAEALAKKVYRAWDLWEKKGNDCFVFSDIITPILISMPTVDAEPVRHGHWVEILDSPMLPLKLSMCSECGAEYAPQQTPHFSYCPHCGAKMDGERKDK